jgi:hypothetical protein
MQYETRGRGFSGPNKHYQSNYNGQHAPQVAPWQNPIPPGDMSELPGHRRGDVHGQRGEVQGQQHLNHQMPLGQGSQQRGAHMQQPKGNKEKVTSGGSHSVEISTLPANMVALFQEFLVSLPRKKKQQK